MHSDAHRVKEMCAAAAMNAPYLQPVRLAGSFRCWFVKKYCWLVCVREKYCSGWKITIVYDKPQPNEQAACVLQTSVHIICLSVC